MLRTKLAALSMAALFLGSSLAIADPITASCPDDIDSTDGARDIEITAPDAFCYAYGTGNISGAIDPINFADDSTIHPGDVLDHVTPGDDDWYFLAESVGGTGTLVSYNAELGEIYLDESLAAYDIIGLLIKVGGGTLDPDWAFFTLSYTPIVYFSISDGDSRISHAGVYAVPEPATVGLLGLGLAGLGLGLRRRRKI